MDYRKDDHLQPRHVSHADDRTVGPLSVCCAWGGSAKAGSGDRIADGSNEASFVAEVNIGETASGGGHHILGVQANTWTEHMRTFARVQHAIFPRIAALAEVAWSPREARDYDGFLRRLPAQLRRYDALDIAYAHTPFEVRAEAQASASAPGRATVSLSNALGYKDIHYTLDGSAPKANSLRYEQPFDIALPAQVEAAAFFGGQPLLPAADTHRFSADALREQADLDARSTMTHVDRLIDVVARHVTPGRLAATLDRLTAEGITLGMPHNRYLSEKLWELRFRCGQVNQRITYTADPDRQHNQPRRDEQQAAERQAQDDGGLLWSRQLVGIVDRGLLVDQLRHQPSATQDRRMPAASSGCD